MAKKINQQKPENLKFVKMASALFHLSSMQALVTLISLLSFCSCFNPKLYNVSNSGFATTVATWYGPPNGAGSDSGACGYQSAVEGAPFNKLISAGGPSLYSNGQECGACYQVKCNSNPACSGNPVTITLTDLCPAGCAANQFDLSGTAFGAMAAPGKAAQLRNAGRLNIQYQRVPCNYPGVKIIFSVDKGSNQYYFATTIEYEAGDGDLSKVELQNGSGPFRKMDHSWGATWKFNSGVTITGPLSLKLTSHSGKSVTAQNVIPVGWAPGKQYRSHINF